MIINTVFKRAIAIVLLSCLTSVSQAANNEGDGDAPKASAAETQLSFRELPYLEKAYINVAPKDLADGLSVGKLGADGGNKEMIIKLAEEIAIGQHGKFDSLLVAHKGKLLFESYYLRGRVDLPHPQASATKAYTGLALGRAIQLGYLTMADLDKPLFSFLKGLDPSKFVKGIESITLNHALTMRGGIRIDEEQWTELEKNPSSLQGQDFVQALFEKSAPVTLESQGFSYGNFNPDLVMQVVDALVPGTAHDFIKTELLDKMGISQYGWKTGVSGLPTGGARASMTSRAMMKFGMLAMNQGNWKGEQLIPRAFMTKAIDRIFYTGDDDFHYGGKHTSGQGYGYYWWSADLHYGDKRFFSSSAQGGWGQFIIVVKELDLLVVFTGHDNDTAYLQIMAERILPAFVQ